MGLFDLIVNTVEGAAQATLNAAKLPLGVLVAPLDDGKTITDAADGLVEGVQKIGDAEGRDDG